MIDEYLKRDRWHGGQLLAFSGLDGTTDYENALVGRTAFDGPGIEIVLPARCSLSFPALAGEVVLTGDFFFVETQTGKVRGAFLDAYHLLIEGPCEVIPKSDGIAVHTTGERTLIACASHLNGKNLHLNATEFERVFAARGRWLREREFAADLRPAARRTLSKAFSVMKTQVYSPEGRITHRWTTPDR